jgi:aspartate/methionine/tyrosine aminotransferase
MSDIRLAARTAQIAPFQVMELVKRAVQLEQQGRPIIHLSIGEPDFTAPEPVITALERAARAGRTQYTAAVGTQALREAIAGDYRSRHGVEIDPSRIVVTAGASAALSLACCALVDPGDEVLLTDPSYPCNRHFVAAFDGVPRPVPVFADTRFQMTEAHVVSHWGPKVRGVLLASPANPTGTSIPFAELGRIVEAVRGRGGFTIVDEIYLGLTYEGRARTALELGEDVIVTNSFSKYFHMTGWRLGWMVVPAALAPTFEKLAQNLYICASTLAQHAALACFEPASLATFEARREAFRERRDFIVPAMRAIGFEVPVMPDGAFYAWLDGSRYGDSGALASRLLDEASVSLVPGYDFGVNEPGRWMRLSYATPLPALREAVERIGRCLGAG